MVINPMIFGKKQGILGLKNIILDYDGTICKNIPRVEKMLDDYFGYAQKELSVSKEILIINYCNELSDSLKNPFEKKWIVNGYHASYYEDEILFYINSFIDSLEKNYPKNDFNELKGAEFFNSAYKKTSPDFGKSVDVLEKLSKKYELFIVSNSSTKNILRETENLGIDLKVIGNAKKYIVCNKIEGLGKELIQGNGWSANILRPNYFDALKGFNPKESLAVGDNFSLDLALPFCLGFNVGLVKHKFNSWAKDFLNNNGHFSIKDLTDLDDILA